jgi:transposase
MVITDRNGIPLTVQTESAQKSEFQLAMPTVNQIEVPIRPKHPKKNPDALCADRGYDSKAIRKALRKKGITPYIPKRRKPGKKEEPSYNKKIKHIYRFRGTVERTIAWMGWSRRLVVRWERLDVTYQAFINVACIMICLRVLK